MTTSIYLGRNGQQLGPFTTTKLSEMLNANAVLPGDLAWVEGMDEWEDAGTVLKRLGIQARPAAAQVTPSSHLRTQQFDSATIGAPGPAK
jgi:hypothetical protein